MILGGRQFESNLIQGPLAGVSSAPFRLLTHRYSQPAFSCTEMISCKTIIHQRDHSQKRFLYKDPNEGAVCYQLSATDPHELAEAIKRVTDCGADLVDLNCGCPVNKIRSKGAGSRLLASPQLLFQLMRAMKTNTTIPVSIKIRVDGTTDQYNHDIINAIMDAGIDFVTVHGRHWTEGYDVACRYDQINQFVSALPIPVIGNGDVKCYPSYQAMLVTGCAGVMIGRAGVGQPWLIRQLEAETQSTHFQIPTNVEIGEVLIEHVERLAILLNSDKFAVFQARKFAKYYSRPLINRAEFMNHINLCESLPHFTLLCREFFN